MGGGNVGTVHGASVLSRGWFCLREASVAACALLLGGAPPFHGHSFSSFLFFSLLYSTHADYQSSLCSYSDFVNPVGQV